MRRGDVTRCLVKGPFAPHRGRLSKGFNPSLEPTVEKRAQGVVLLREYWEGNMKGRTCAFRDDHALLAERGKAAPRVVFTCVK